LGITAVLTNLLETQQTQRADQAPAGGIPMSSLIDSWILLRDNEIGGERTRLLYIIKSKGMAHSNQVREFILTSSGIDLVDVCIGEAGVLTGAARETEIAKARMVLELRKQDAKALEVRLQQRRTALETEHRFRLLKLDQDEAIARNRLAAREQRDRMTERDRNLLAEDLSSRGALKKLGGAA
jgi:circadian clock protein KaiC